MKPNRVIVAGSRTFANYTLLDHKLTHILQRLTPADTAILSGCARGADQLAEHWAWAHGYDVLRFPANWNELDKRAGYLRNEEMARQATHLVAFWNGQSKGTSSMITLARQAGLKVVVVRF